LPTRRYPASEVKRELDSIIAVRGIHPLLGVSDNGTELTSNAVLAWCQDNEVGWHYTAPGKRQQNALAESFRRALFWLPRNAITRRYGRTLGARCRAASLG
jgi:transposase InsO family protein